MKVNYCAHTDLKEDGPTGSLIKWLNEDENFESYKIIYNNIVGAYTVAFLLN